uniref:Zinc finger protein 330 n=1 Tax=Parascaris univalens TaxID=6257 RepID=A0A915ADK2_PARUN
TIYIAPANIGIEAQKATFAVMGAFFQQNFATELKNSRLSSIMVSKMNSPCPSVLTAEIMFSASLAEIKQCDLLSLFSVSKCLRRRPVLEKRQKSSVKSRRRFVPHSTKIWLYSHATHRCNVSSVSVNRNHEHFVISVVHSISYRCVRLVGNRNA